jgi:hypothetical protein
LIWTGYRTPHPVTFQLNVTRCLEAGIVESEETAVARLDVIIKYTSNNGETVGSNTWPLSYHIPKM